MKTKLYLAGPIGGLGYEEAALGWRAETKQHLAKWIEPVDPTRTMYENDGSDVLYLPKLLMERSKMDVDRSDAMLACWLDAPGVVSCGTLIEFGWAHAKGIPIFLVSPKKHKAYPFLPHMCWHVYEQLGHAILDINKIYEPDSKRRN